MIITHKSNGPRSSVKMKLVAERLTKFKGKKCTTLSKIGTTDKVISKMHPFDLTLEKQCKLNAQKQACVGAERMPFPLFLDSSHLPK